MVQLYLTVDISNNNWTCVKNINTGFYESYYASTKEADINSGKQYTFATPIANPYPCKATISTSSTEQTGDYNITSLTFQTTNGKITTYYQNGNSPPILYSLVDNLDINVTATISNGSTSDTLVFSLPSIPTLIEGTTPIIQAFTEPPSYNSSAGSTGIYVNASIQPSVKYSFTTGSEETYKVRDGDDYINYTSYNFSNDFPFVFEISTVPSTGSDYSA